VGRKLIMFPMAARFYKKKDSPERMKASWDDSVGGLSRQPVLVLYGVEVWMGWSQAGEKNGLA